MGIENLLAQGVQIRPAGMERNALMQAQEFKDRQQRNALMQMQMQDVSQQRQLAIQQAQREAAQKQELDREMMRIQGGGQLDPVRLLQLKVPQAQIEFLANRGNLGRQEVAREVERRGADGMPEKVMLDKYNSPVGGAFPQAVKLEMKDVGNRLVPTNPYTQTSPLTKTQTPDSIASIASQAAARAQAERHWKATQGNADAPTWDASNQVWVDRKKQTLTPGVGPDGKPLQGKGGGTVDERNAAGYSSRMAEATKLLDQYEADGRATYKTNAAGGIPFVGAASRTAAMDSTQQMYRQAQEDWVRAKLRKESGAAIGADEMDREILAYFPQPGELTGVVEQKRRARLIANEAMARSSGKAAYTSEVPAQVAPTFNTPTDPNAGALDLLRRADAIVGR